MLTKLPKLFIYLLGAVFILNILQAHFTELIFDEAYYWYYSQNMAWGYFDHPPMVVLLIKLSSYFFEGELGVRFMSCVLSVGTLVLLWLSIDKGQKENYIGHFFVLTFSTALLNAYGFLTLPDTPFLFFTTAFLLVYKEFMKSPSAVLSIALGILMAALMYSKYNAILVIIFVLLSNLKLLTNKYAWLALIISLVCYTPHLLWLYQNDFITIQYHLVERSNHAYDFEEFTLGYFLNLLGLFGFIFPWVCLSLFKTKSSDQFTRTLMFVTYGVLIFFFISSFLRRIQPQWLIVISIPVILLVFNQLVQNEGIRKWIYRMGVLNIVILMYLRIGLVYESLLPIHYESHGNKEWVNEISSQAGNLPVVFENSYRNASMYSFYSGNLSFSLNNIWYRLNQYSIDETESKLQGKKILFTSSNLKDRDFTFSKNYKKIVYGKYITNFESFRRLQCFVDEKPLKNYQNVEHILKVYNPYDSEIRLSKLKFGVAYLNNFKERESVQGLKTTPVNQNVLTLKSKDTVYFRFKLPKPLVNNPKFFKIGISENGFGYGLNGENIKLE